MVILNDKLPMARKRNTAIIGYVAVVIGIVGMIATALFLSLALYILISVAIIPWQIETGRHWKGIDRKYHQAMKDGDGQAAVHWAKKAYEHEHSDIFGNKSMILREKAPRWLAQAYELDGQFEEAVRWYAIVAANSQTTPPPWIPRLLFKQGRREEAFKAYCEYGAHCLEEYAKEFSWKDRAVGTASWCEYDRTLGYIQNAITMEHFVDVMISRPFIDYEDFLVFMEEEYEKLDYPEEYAEVMELFRLAALVNVILLRLQKYQPHRNRPTRSPCGGQILRGAAHVGGAE